MSPHDFYFFAFVFNLYLKTILDSSVCMKDLIMKSEDYLYEYGNTNYVV